MLHRALIALFLGVSLVGILGAYAPAAHAAACTSGYVISPNDLQTYNYDGSPCDVVESSGAPSNADSGSFGGTGANYQTSATPTDNSSQIPIANPDNGSAYASVMQWIMKLFAWLVGVAAITLQNAVYYTVVVMGDYVSHLTAIGVAWRILRDIGNILLIFGFLAIGLATILNTEIYGWGQKMLPKLLIAAIFLNFSLFITEAVIDVGNLFATQFYTQINGGTFPQPVNSNFMSAISNEGISNKIMAQVGLQDIYGGAVTNQAVFAASNSWLVGFMAIILFIVTAFVMFSLAFILIARFVVLLFLIVVAPIGFVGYAIPKLQKIADEWSSTLINETITAPILLLLLYIALAIITDSSFLTGFGAPANGPQWLGFVNNGNMTGFAATVMSFLVAMGLLLAVTIVAKKMASIGSGVAMKWAGNASFGVAGALGRGTVGWGSQRGLDRWQKSRLARAPIIGRAVSGVLGAGATGAFDVRSTKALKSLPMGGVDAGQAQKGGYQKWEKDKIEGRTKYAKDLKQTKAEEATEKAEKERAKLVKQAGRDLTAQNKTERAEMTKRHDEAAKPFRDDLAAKTARLRALEARASLGEAISEPEYSAARAAVDDAAKILNDRQTPLRIEAQNLREEHQRMEKAQEKEVKEREEALQAAAKAPQMEYAKGIVWGPGSFFNRNKVASKKILDEAKKKKGEKELEVLRKVLEDNAAPAPAAPATPPAAPGP